MDKIDTGKSVSYADIHRISLGAAAFGSGGGGDPYIGKLAAQQAITKHGDVELVSLENVPDDAAVFPVGMMGAPTVMIEKLLGSDQLKSAITTLARYIGRPPEFIACSEIGGVNSTFPIAAAAELGLPLIDGDAMGRAFPELQMTLPTLYGISASPVAVSDEKGNTAVFDAVSNRWTEIFARDVVIDMGTSAAISLYPMTGKQVKASYVSGSISRCYELGAAIESARAAHASPIAAACNVLAGRQFFTGKLSDVERRTEEGFARGKASISAESTSDTAEVLFQNENLILKVNGETVATTPDLIILFESDTGEPLPTESLRFGQRVAIIVSPADPRWHSEAGISVAGPRYFGYDVDPIRLDPSLQNKSN